MEPENYVILQPRFNDIKKVKLKMLISFLLFLLLTSIQVKAACSPKAQDIPVYKQGAHLGTRTTEPSVTASLEQNQLTVNVGCYMGIVKVYVYGGNGSLMTSSSAAIEGNGLCSLDLSAFENGSYNVTIELGDMIYWGIFDI